MDKCGRTTLLIHTEHNGGMELFNRLDPAVHEGLNEALGHRADVLAHGVGEGVVLVGTRSALARLIGDSWRVWGWEEVGSGSWAGESNTFWWRTVEGERFEAGSATLAVCPSCSRSGSRPQPSSRAWWTARGDRCRSSAGAAWARSLRSTGTPCPPGALTWRIRPLATRSSRRPIDSPLSTSDRDQGACFADSHDPDGSANVLSRVAGHQSLVAQLAEHSTVNRRVTGSSPVRGASVKAALTRCYTLSGRLCVWGWATYMRLPGRSVGPTDRHLAALASGGVEGRLISAEERHRLPSPVVGVLARLP